MLRVILIGLKALILVVAYSGLSNAASFKDTTHEIAPGVYNFSPAGSHYFSMFVVTDDGVAVFETVNTRHSTSMLKAIREVTDKPLKYVFHSHNHWDHANGGGVLQEAGAQTVMHKLAADWLEENPSKDSSPPDVVWDGDRHDIKLGGLTIQLHHLGLNHGLGMTVFVIPELRAGYIADLVTPNRVMFMIVPDFNITGWERSLEEIQALDFDVAVCSHNALPAEELFDGCNKSHVASEHQFIKDLKAAVVAEFEKGTKASDVAKLVKLPQYSHWTGYDDWLALNAQRIMLDMWMGPY